MDEEKKKLTGDKGTAREGDIDAGEVEEHQQAKDEGNSVKEDETVISDDTG